MDILIGYTGFVGSNICKMHQFDALFNSKNINEAFGTNPDLCIYCGIRSEKYIANKFPDADLKHIEEAIENIKKIKPKKLVLISTIDVYTKPFEVNEDSQIDSENNLPYGKNRRYLEQWIQENIKNHLIIRLPGLYGFNLKKNFIYDYIEYIPKLLKIEKYQELFQKNQKIKDYYFLNMNGFYELNIKDDWKDEVKQFFANIGFSALNFTDSRGTFQYYNLSYLWYHIQIALKNNIKLLNIVTEPVSIHEIYYKLENKDFINEITSNVPYYNITSKHAHLFSKINNYIFNKEFVINDIYKYIKQPVLRLSISNLAWDNNDSEEIYKAMLKYGFKGLEIAPMKLFGPNPFKNSEEAKQYVEMINKQYGFIISSLQSIWYGVQKNLFDSDSNYDWLIEYTKQIILFAQYLGCHNLVFGCPKNRNMRDKNSDFLTAEKFFKQIGDYGYQHQVIITLEANPEVYGTNFLNTTSEVIDFVKNINSNGLKVNCDLGTIIINQEDLHVIGENIGLIHHLHISEPFLTAIAQRDLHYDLFTLLIEKDYHGFISIEMNRIETSKIKEILQYIGGLYHAL